MDHDAHLFPLRNIARRGAQVVSEAAAQTLAADIWAWRLQRGEQEPPVFSEGEVFVTETTQDDRVMLRIAAAEVAITVRYARATPAEVWVAPAAAPSREFRFDSPPAVHAMDAPAAAPSLDHVGGASPVEPSRPRPSPRAEPVEPPEGAEPVARPPHCLDLSALLEVRGALTDECGSMPARERIGECVGTLTRCIRALCSAPPSAPGSEPTHDWIGIRSNTGVVVASRDLYVVITADATSANLVKGAFVWQIDRGESSTRLRVDHGEADGDWTVRSSGEVIDHAPPPWRATHTVGAEPAAVGGVPTGTLAAGTVLDPGLDVRVIEITANGWALVECSNGWQCYVAAYSLRAIT